MIFFLAVPVQLHFRGPTLSGSSKKSTIKTKNKKHQTILSRTRLASRLSTQSQTRSRFPIHLAQFHLGSTCGHFTICSLIHQLGSTFSDSFHLVPFNSFLVERQSPIPFSTALPPSQALSSLPLSLSSTNTHIPLPRATPPIPVQTHFIPFRVTCR